MPRSSGPSDTGSVPWWRSFFATAEGLLLSKFPHPLQSHREAESLARLLGLAPGAIVADIPCGPGRHLPHWAAIGCMAVGLDASELMLDLARRISAPFRGRVHLVQGLMQALPFREGVFDVVVNLFNSFGYLEPDEANARVVREAARVLKPGGTFLLDVRNPVLQILFAPYREAVALPDGSKVIASSKYCPRTKRLRIAWTRPGASSPEHHISVRLYSLGELKSMFRAAGLRLKAVYGDFSGLPYERDCAQMVLLAVRQA